MKTVKESYCVFLDILGFSSLIIEASKKNSSNNLLNDFSEVFELSYPFLDKDYFGTGPIFNDGKVRVKSFTDNVVIAVEITSGHGEAEFGDILMSCSNFQLTMALEGYFVRGAFVKGELYMDEKLVFGNAILEAYKLESTQARDPRIILSDDVLKDVRGHLDFYANPEMSPQNDAIIIDTDQVSFINYLSNVHHDYLDWEVLETHKNVIESNLLKSVHNPTVWNKYRWVASYHNWFCLENKNDANYDEKYLIDSKHFVTQPIRLV